MLKEERHRYIIDLVIKDQKVLTSDLSEDLAVSEDTIRRDLKELAEYGQIRKVHGGALAPSLNPFTYHERKVYAEESKKLIAKKAIHLIKDGDVVLLDGGTTNLELVRQLPQDLHATFFTNSLPVAVQLSEHPHIEVVYAGGKLLKSAQVTVGMEVITSFSNIKADLGFLGTRCIDIEGGISEIDWEEAKVKRSIVAASKKLISMPIAEKLNAVHPYKVCEIGQVNTIVSDLDPTDELLTPYRENGIQII